MTRAWVPRSFKWKVIAAAAAVCAACAMGSGLAAARSLSRVRMTTLREHARRLAEELARRGGPAVAGDDIYHQLPALLDAAREADRDFSAAAFYAPSGVPLSTLGERPPAPRPGPAMAEDEASVVAWENCRSPVDLLDPEGPRGTAAVRLSKAGTRRRLARDLAGMAAAALAAAGAGLALVAFLLGRLLAPLELVAAADAAAAAGDREGGDIPTSQMPPDEVGDLMRSRARMMSALRSAEARALESAAAESAKARELAGALDQLSDARERLERSERLSALGRVLAGVAHEINNPLTVILANAQFTLDDHGAALGDRGRSDLEAVLAAAGRCQRIVADLCRFARGERAVLARADLADAARAAVRGESPRLAAAGVAVEEAYDPDLGPVLGDAAQLERLVGNLLKNARQAAAERPGACVRVRVLRRGAAARLEVEDNGPGVPEADRGRLFEPFFSTKPVGAGTGLGLAVSRQIAEQHSGTLAYEPAPGGGARFVLELPVTARGGAQAEVRAAGPERLSVLVVDDEEAVRRVLTRQLAGLGHRVVEADSGAAALKAVEAGSFDCVLCDIRMPGMDGFELLGAVTASRPALRSRWAFVTGAVDRAAYERVCAAGLPVLQKPYTREELAEVLARTAGGGAAV